MADKVVIEVEKQRMYYWDCDMCEWGEAGNIDLEALGAHVRKHMEIYHGVTVDEVKVANG